MRATVDIQYPLRVTVVTFNSVIGVGSEVLRNYEYNYSCMANTTPIILLRVTTALQTAAFDNI